MKTYQIKITGKTPYSQSRHYSEDDVPKLEKESHDAYEKRTWRNRLHVDMKGIVQIPPQAIKNCLAEAAKFLSIQIVGKGKSTYTKHFEAGIMVLDPVSLGVHIDKVRGESLFVPADGRRGGPRRVTKTFPFIEPGWTGSTTIYVVDETITEPVLRKHLVEAGNLIGIGRFRPRNNGSYGRFALDSMVEVEATA